VTQDESEQLSESTLGTESQSSVSTSQDGTSSALSDVDTRPIGACYNELQEVKAAGLALRAAVERAKAANARFWACRDAAQEAAGIVPANQFRQQFLASAFERIETPITDLENMIAAATQTTQEVS